MPPRGSKLQKQKSNSDQQSNIDDQIHLPYPNQKPDFENQSLNKVPDVTDSDEPQPHIATAEIDALMMKSQPNFIIPFNDQEEKSKDFLVAKSNIQDISIDELAKIVIKRECDRNQERVLQNLQRFHKDLDQKNTIQIFNILNFLKECFPFFKHCPFLFKEKKEAYNFYNEIQKFLTFNENDDFFQNYYYNLSSFTSDYINLFSYQYNFKSFQNAFRQSFSKLTSILSNSVQQILDRGRTNNFESKYRTINDSLTTLFISFKTLMNTQRIRTSISFVDKLSKTKSDFIQFLRTNDLMNEERVIVITEQLEYLNKLTLHVKMMFITHQFIEIIDQIISKINNKRQLKLENNEIIKHLENQLNTSSYELFDQFNFKIKGKTEFLALANEFIQQLSPGIELDDFKNLLKELLSRSYTLLKRNIHQCGLNPVFFSLHYHYRMIQAATSSIIPLLRSEPLGQTKYLQKIFIALRILLKKFSSLEGQVVDLSITNDLSFSLIMNIKHACHEDDLKSSYKGTAAFQNAFKHIKLFVKNLRIIEDTICFTHQVDNFLQGLQIIDKESCFNLKCRIYSPPKKDYNSKYNSRLNQIDHNEQTDNYDAIINEISYQLHCCGYDILPKNYSQNTFYDILAPNLSRAILIMLNYGDNIQIQKLIESPNVLGNEEQLFLLINDVYKKVIEFPQNALQLKESLFVYIQSYFLLRALNLAGKINFSNSVHLMYFKSFTSILFNDEFIGKVSLISPFNPSNHPCYRSILKRLTNLKEMKQVNDEISHIRLFFFKFAGDVFQLDPRIVMDNLEIFNRIFEWFTNPSKSSNDKFLSYKYLEPVKNLKNLFTEIIHNTKEVLDTSTSIFIVLREIESILNSINNIQLHYIQFRKTQLVTPYLRSFFSCKEEDKEFCRFISYYPIWLNAVHRCSEYKLIKLDHELLDKSFRSTPSNVLPNSGNLIKSFEIQYLDFFNDLISYSIKTNEQSITMITDVIIRGSLSFNNVSKLYTYLLKYFVSNSDQSANHEQQQTGRVFINSNNGPKSQFFISPLKYELWRNATKLSCFLIALNMHSFLREKLNYNLLRIFNLKNYINSYINGFLYLHNSALSSSLDKESSRKILIDLKELQRMILDFPIVVKIKNTVYQLNKIISIVMSVIRYICISGSEEGIIKSIESYIRNIQDKKINEAFTSSFNVALLAGTNSQGATTLLSKTPQGTPVSTAQAAIINGHESVFYNNDEENYLDDLDDVLEKYLDADEELRDFIQRNTDNYGNSNYFKDDDDLNVNLRSCALHKSLIDICFKDDERRVDNYMKAIDKINLLSLYLSIIKETNSFIKFVSLDIHSYIRLNPPYAIFKPQSGDKIDTLINLTEDKVEEDQHQEEENVFDKDWMKNSFIIFNSCIDDHFGYNYDSNAYCESELTFKEEVENNNAEFNLNQHKISIQAKIQAQLQILPFQYAFDDTGVSFAKFRFKSLYINAQQVLKNKLPSLSPLGEIVDDQLLPQQIQQEAIDQIDYISKGLNPEYIEELKKQSLKEQKEKLEKNIGTISSKKNDQKEAPPLPKVIIKDRERLLKKDNVSHSAGESETENENEPETNQEEQMLSTSANLKPEIIIREDEEEEKQENDFAGIDESVRNELANIENEEDEDKKVVKPRRGRPARKKERGRGRGGKNSLPERSNSLQTTSLPLSSVSSIGTGIINESATGTLSYINHRMIKLNQLENEEAKRRENNESFTKVHPLVTSTISRMGNEIKHLSKTSNVIIDKKNEYYDVMMKSQVRYDFLVKKEQLKQTQNTSRSLTLSSSIAQTAIDSYNENKKVHISNSATNPNQENIKTSYNLFNPFNLFDSNNNKSSTIEKVENDKIKLANKEEEEEELNDLSISDLLQLHQNQIKNIAQIQIKQKQQQKLIDNEKSVNIQNKVSRSSSDHEKNSTSLQQNQLIDGNMNNIIEEDLNKDEIQQDSTITNSQNDLNLLSFEEAIHNESRPDEMQFINHENPNFAFLSPSLQKRTRPWWACLNKEEIESNLILNDMNQRHPQNSSHNTHHQHHHSLSFSHLYDNSNENNEELRENYTKGQKIESENAQNITFNNSPSELQQRYNLCKRRIQAYEAIANERTKSSFTSNKKQNRTKNDTDFASKNKNTENNDAAVMSDASVEMTGDSDVGFGLDGDLGFGFETESGNNNI